MVLHPQKRSALFKTLMLACSATMAAGCGDELAPANPETATAGVGEVHQGVTRTLSPGMDVRLAFEQLQPGDTLVVSPGVYEIGSLGPNLKPGLSSARINVTASDPNNPPLFKGWLILRRPTNWTINRIRVQATVAGREAMTVAGGLHWSIQNSEFFGASNTGAFANVAISSWNPDPSTGTCAQKTTCENPQHWEFIYNCIHHAGLGTATGHTQSTDHNVYVNANGYSPGYISRNIMFLAPAGSHVKVGSGGSITEPGASGVRIRYNTLHNAARSVLISGNLTGVEVNWNLFKKATGGDGVSAGTYLNGLSNPKGVYVVDNYGHDMDRNLYVNPNVEPGSYVAGGEYGNPVYNTVETEPGFDASSCTGYHPSNATAKKFGRYSTYFGSGI